MHPALPLRAAVTGGTSGLGRALVSELTRRGAHVAIVARTADAVERVARDHPHTHGIVGDVARKDDIYPIALQILGELGGLDVLINNASSLGPATLRLLADTDCEDLELALATNLLGPFRLTKAVLGALSASAREGRGGVVLNVSSDAAVNAYPSWGAYGASKAALRHMSGIWNEELAGEGVRFLSIDPGDMDTPLHAIAVPDADPATLKRPEQAARELVDEIFEALAVPVAPKLEKVSASVSGLVAPKLEQVSESTAELVTPELDQVSASVGGLVAPKLEPVSESTAELVTPELDQVSASVGGLVAPKLEQFPGA